MIILVTLYLETSQSGQVSNGTFGLSLWFRAITYESGLSLGTGWQTSNMGRGDKLNVGIEIALFKDHFTQLTAEYYNIGYYDLLKARITMIGIAYPDENIGKPLLWFGIFHLLTRAIIKLKYFVASIYLFGQVKVIFMDEVRWLSLECSYRLPVNMTFSYLTDRFVRAQREAGNNYYSQLLYNPEILNYRI